jgi:hypothetical protein
MHPPFKLLPAASIMFNKIFLLFLTVIIAAPILTPAVLAEKPIMAVKSNADQDKQEIKKVINQNIASINSGDNVAYLKTVAPTSKEYKNAIENPNNLKIVQAFGLIFKLQELDYVQVTSNQAEVKVKLISMAGKTGFAAEMEKMKKQSGRKVNPDGSVTTMKVTGGFEKSQFATGTIKLGKINGKWLIVAMDSQKSSANNTSMSRVTSTTIPSQPIRPADQKIFQQVFTKHLQALNQENLGNYLATLDLKSPNYPTAKTSTIKLFKDYDLKYELKAVDVISMGQQDAVVKLTATVKKLKGGEFTDSQMVTINNVRKTNGQWRIYDTQVENISPLNSPAKNVSQR